MDGAIDAKLYAYGLRLGIDSVRSGRLRDALRYFIRPVNYWRAVEYRLVWHHAGFRPDARVLDVGSPKLLSLYLAEHLQCRVTATDIDPYFLDNQLAIQRIRRIGPSRLDSRTEDGRELTFNDDSFDVAYAISVVEHIPADGDSACLAEMGRVIAPGGRVVLTVPFHTAYREEHLPARRFYWSQGSGDNAQLAFYQRRYDEEALHRRLIEPSGLELASLTFVGEVALAPQGREISDFLPAATGPVQPLMSRAFHRGPTSDWRTLRRPLCAAISLRKPGAPA